jgi:hypothetical protein
MIGFEKAVRRGRKAVCILCAGHCRSVYGFHVCIVSRSRVTNLTRFGLPIPSSSDVALADRLWSEVVTDVRGCMNVEEHNNLARCDECCL